MKEIIFCIAFLSLGFIIGYLFCYIKKRIDSEFDRSIKELRIEHYQAMINKLKENKNE